MCQNGDITRQHLLVSHLPMRKIRNPAVRIQADKSGYHGKQAAEGHKNGTVCSISTAPFGQDSKNEEYASDNQ